MTHPKDPFPAWSADDIIPSKRCKCCEKCTCEFSTPLITELLALHNVGIIGTIELREWLTYVFPDFEKARNPEVDSMINHVAQERERESSRLREVLYVNEKDGDNTTS